MFIRVKTKPGNHRKAVQLVESVRGGKTVRKRLDQGLMAPAYARRESRTRAISRARTEIARACPDVGCSGRSKSAATKVAIRWDGLSPHDPAGCGARRVPVGLAVPIQALIGPESRRNEAVAYGREPAES